MADLLGPAQGPIELANGSGRSVHCLGQDIGNTLGDTPVTGYVSLG
jgi:hypothetical protein